MVVGSDRFIQLILKIKSLSQRIVSMSILWTPLNGLAVSAILFVWSREKLALFFLLREAIAFINPSKLLVCIIEIT